MYLLVDVRTPTSKDNNVTAFESNDSTSMLVRSGSKEKVSCANHSQFEYISGDSLISYSVLPSTLNGVLNIATPASPMEMDTTGRPFLRLSELSSLSW